MRQSVLRLTQSKYINYVLITVVLAPLLLVWQLQQNKVNSIAELVTESVRRGTIEQLVPATGILEASDYVEVGAQVSGKIEKLHVSEGDKVVAGQLLVEIDARVFESKVKKSKASLANQRAQLLQLQAQLELAEKRLKRDRFLASKGAVSQDTLQAKETDLRVLKARISGVNAQILNNQASLEEDQVKLSYSKIYAPISGTVTSLPVRVGKALNATNSSPVLLKISNLFNMTLKAEISEADIVHIKKNMPVRFSMLGAPDKFYYSSVEKVLPKPLLSNDVVLYQALIKADNKSGRMKEGMSTQVFFIKAQSKKTLIVPLAAVVKNRKGSFVKVLNEDNEQELIPVTLGLKNRTQTEVVSGLNISHRIIVGSKNSSPASRGRPRRGL